MKLLTFSTLYPNEQRPGFGVFVENRLRQLIARGKLECRVVAPVPWFPFRHSRFGEYAVFAAIGPGECRHGISIVHPRYPLIPRVGMTIAPLLMALACLPALKKIIRSGYDFDVIDAHYFYPDGVAAAWLGKWLSKPVVITARGSDVNLISQYRFPRFMILQAAANVKAIITVSQALKDSLIRLGVAADKITVLRNGVDLIKFSPPENREFLRHELGFSGRVILSVGNLIALKGHELTIRAVAQLPDVRLYIAGIGPEREHLTRLIKELNIARRVTLLGAIPHEHLHRYYGAADILVLASSREGWPNVLLESMACGTPVIATSVGGTPEVVTTRESGKLIHERSVESLRSAISEMFADYPDRSLTRKYAENFSWDETTDGQFKIFTSILGN